jgi:hypothetical protein
MALKKDILLLGEMEARRDIINLHLLQERTTPYAGGENDIQTRGNT